MKRDARQHSFAPTDPLAVPVSPEVFKCEVRAWATRLDVGPAEVRLMVMSQKWASCSTRGRVTFSTDLLSQPAGFRREVILHELLHLKVPNHGPLFRALLSTHLNGVGVERSKTREYAEGQVALFAPSGAASSERG